MDTFKCKRCGKEFAIEDLIGGYCEECMEKEINEEAVKTSPKESIKKPKKEDDKLRMLSKKYILITIGIIAIILIIIVVVSSKKPKGVGSIGMSPSEYDRIVMGDTITKVNDKITERLTVGDYPKVVSTVSEKKDGDKTIIVYRYEGENGGYALITVEKELFIETVISKENHGLK